MHANCMVPVAIIVSLLIAPARTLTWPSLFAQSLSGASHAPQKLSEPERPIWPSQYEISWQFLLPYVSELQSTPLIYNYTVYQDSDHGRQKIVRNSVETTMEVIDTDTMYELYPRINEMRCSVHKIDNPDAREQSAATSRKLLQVKAPQLGFVLPDLSEDRWAYNGTATVHGQEANSWITYDKKEMGYGDIVSTYTMYVSKEGEPLEFHMFGVDLYMQSHFDDWIVDVTAWRPGQIEEGNWLVPHFCKQAEAEQLQRHKLDSSLAMEVARQMPNPHYGDEHYDAFVHKHSRRHLTKDEYHQRSQRFHEVRQIIEEHNSKPENSHKLALNRFADWHKEEFLATILPNHGKVRSVISSEGKQPKLHKPKVPEHMLPSTVDWMGTGADSPVKDQASCGSCWAFGTIGPVETAYFRETGKQLLLSEQELLDCGWYLNNKACFGGYQDMGLQWLMDKGRVATLDAYPYEGGDNFCSAKGRKYIEFSGDFVQTDGTEYGLKEALFTKGPMTVSVDAAPDSFVFYSSGIYNNTECKSDYKDLDHAVLVSGYGTTDEGQEYWLVKNTWSAYWGDQGYIKIARHPQDCGIATQPMFVELDLKQS